MGQSPSPSSFQVCQLMVLVSFFPWPQPSLPVMVSFGGLPRNSPDEEQVTTPPPIPSVPQHWNKL